MPTPFPGMDPYLEHPALWPDVHNRLIAELGNTLGPLLRPRYIVRLQERTYLEDVETLTFSGGPDLTVRIDPRAATPASSPPDRVRAETSVDVEIPMPAQVRETYLVIQATGSREVVTVLELLSPSNKVPGKGRDLYRRKRSRIFASETNLVEVDLVRTGQALPAQRQPRSLYRILVSRSDQRPGARLFPFGERDSIPCFRLPLRGGDEEPEVDVGAALRRLYDAASYDLDVDYGKPPVPPLQPEDAAWADALLQERGLRPRRGGGGTAP